MYVSTHIPNIPDVVFVDISNQEVLLLEVGYVFDLYIDEAFQAKDLKNQLLLEAFVRLGYTCRYYVHIFGNIGHVHECSTGGLKIADLANKEAKQKVMFCLRCVWNQMKHIMCV